MPAKKHNQPVHSRQMDWSSITSKKTHNMTSAKSLEILAMDNKVESATLSKLHVLSLPIEIRQAIWQAMLDDIDKSRKSKWFTKPCAEFLPLMLACRQLHREIQSFRLQHLVPFTSFAKFACSLEDVVGINPSNSSKYRSMTIEFRRDASLQKYQCLEYILYTCKDTLEELHLSFIGPDKYGMVPFLHGCAYDEYRGIQSKLIPEGQHKRMLKILLTIFQMTKLRILVLSNLNFPLLPTVFKHKPQLEYLHITADPRSAVHTFTKPNDLGVLLTPFDNFFPPIKVLNISTSSMLNAVALPSKCARTLEHLTWTVPDAYLGSNLVEADLFAHTRQLMDNFALNRGKLRTLRICIQGTNVAGHVDRLDDLEAALTTNIGLLSSLREVEIHSEIGSAYFGDAILRALPLTVERFYAKDQLIKPRELHRFISMKYLSSQPQPVLPDSLPLGNDGRTRMQWWPHPPSTTSNRHETVEIPAFSTDEEQIKLWLHPDPMNTDPIYHQPQHASDDYEIHRKIARRGEVGLFPNGGVGKDQNRKDYIPMANGNLTFVAYDFRNPDFICPDQETTTHMVLRLNGRLLDRAHNKHLSHNPAGDFIKPLWADDGWPELDGDETWHASEDQNCLRYLAGIYGLEIMGSRDVTAAFAELKASPFVDDEQYFGNIEEAYRTFQAERTAKPQDIPKRTYPFYVDNDGDCDGQCHWMCPEADVPTLAQLDEIRAAGKAQK